MNDHEIRGGVVPYLSSLDGVLKREVVFEDTRADLIRLTDKIIGYEIKGHTDCLWGDRAKKQIVAYNLLYDECWVVIDHSRAWEADMVLPEHWGILLISGSQVLIGREATQNNCISRRSLAESLHLAEIHDIQRDRKQPLVKPKRDAVRHIATSLNTDELRQAVIAAWLKRKENA